MRSFIGLRGVGTGFATLLMCAGLPLTARGHASQPTRPEIRKLMRTATTAEDYERLAGYFRAQQAEFRGKAQEEAAAGRHYQTSTRPKVPTAADNARSWCEYYTRKADRAGALAGKYEALSAPARSAGSTTGR